jgi:hypothetical protein
LAFPAAARQKLDGARPDVVTDVAIETEHALWTLMVAADRNRWNDDSDRIAQLVDAGAWLAGARAYYCGLIETESAGDSFGAMLKSRYSRSGESVRLRSATRGPAAPAVSACGALTWSDLAAILRDCQNAHNLPAIERALAQNAVVWLRTVGIHPATD